MRRMICLLAALLLALVPGPGSGLAEEEPAIFLELIPASRTAFTNVLLHYVYFDADVRNAERITLQLLNPEGEPVPFRTRKHVDNHFRPVRSAGYPIRKGQEKAEGLNVLFPSGMVPGTWTIAVTASASRKETVTRQLKVEISGPQELVLTGLEKAHSLLTGTEGGALIPAEKGKIRYIAQDPKDSLFVKEYWFSGAFDLRDKANQMCSRAVLSMALSWLGIDCTPIRMSEMLRSRDLFYTYDQVCEALGNVSRTEGDLDTLWREYEQGNASPVLLHFDYDGGMHAVLLVARDEANSELFYAVTPGQRVNTAAFPDGRKRDMVIPLLIEKGEIGERIQSPLLKRYHRGVIDQIWQWTVTGE